MNINKAIKKQNKSYKRFRLIMCFIFFILPIILFLSNNLNIFFIIYLLVIEVLVLILLIKKRNADSLTFTTQGYKVKISEGFPSKEYNVSCSKVIIVHAENKDKDMQLVVISKSKFRNKRIKAIDLAFFKKYPHGAYPYAKVKNLYPEEEFFYFVIKEGGYKKYSLLNELYKTCINGIFTEEAINQIKIFRNN